MPKPASATSLQAWDDLRREARKLEAELDTKLAAYAKLCSSFDSGFTRGEAGLAADQLAQSKAAAIEEMLERASDVIERLSGALSGASDPRSHTLARHRDILHDYTQEFRRLRGSYSAQMDRAELLSGAGESAPLMGGQAGSSMLLRERGNLQSADRAACIPPISSIQSCLCRHLDEVIGSAEAVTGSLGEQRTLFESIGSKLGNVVTRFPAVNGLLNAVRRKKNRDTLILSSVIAACTLFMLIYWWRK